MCAIFSVGVLFTILPVLFILYICFSIYFVAFCEVAKSINGTLKTIEVPPIKRWRVIKVYD